MHLERLRYFITLAEELHFTSAARRLYLDQSALSASIRRLERDLGIRLFERTSRRVELTEAGAALLPRARRLIEEAQLFLAAAQRQRDHERRDGGPLRLHIGVQCAGLAELNEIVLSVIRKRYPNCTVSVQRLSFPMLFEAYRTLDCHAIIGTAGLFGDCPDITFTPIYEDRLVAMVNPSGRLGTADELTIADLLPLAIVPNTSLPRPWGDPFDLRPYRNGTPPRTLDTRPPAGNADLAEMTLCLDAVTPTAQSDRLLPECRQVRLVPISDSPGLVFGIYSFIGNESAARVSAILVEAAQKVADNFLDLVPGVRRAHPLGR